MPGIALTAPARCRRGDECPVQGVFRIEAPVGSGGPPEVSQVVPHEVHRSITLAVTSLHENWTLDPFRLALLFEDDVRADANGVTGEFTVDLGADRGFRHPGRYYVTASLQRHTSNTVLIEVA